MSSRRPPQLDLSSSGSGPSFKRNFDQFGLDLDSPGGSGSDNERNKRARSETADRRPTPGPSTLQASTSSATLEDGLDDEQTMATENGASLSPSPLHQAFQVSSSPPNNGELSPDFLNTPFPADASSGLFPLVVESDAEEVPVVSAPAAPAARHISPHPLVPSQVRASVQRYETFDSNISALRDSANASAPSPSYTFRSSAPPPTLPPLAHLTSQTSHPYNPVTLPGLSSVGQEGTAHEPPAPTSHELPGSSGAAESAASRSASTRRSYRERLDDATQHINTAIDLLLSPELAPRLEPPVPAPLPRRHAPHLPNRQSARTSFPILEEDDAMGPFGPTPQAHGRDTEMADRTYGHSLASYLTALTGSRDRERPAPPGFQASRGRDRDGLASASRPPRPPTNGTSSIGEYLGLSRSVSTGGDSTGSAWPRDLIAEDHRLLRSGGIMSPSWPQGPMVEDHGRPRNDAQSTSRDIPRRRTERTSQNAPPRGTSGVVLCNAQYIHTNCRSPRPGTG